MHPSPLVHDGFHKILDLGGILACALTMLALAWGPVRSGTRWGFIGLSAVVPGAALFTWAGAVALANNTEWGRMHVLLEGYAAAMPILLVLAIVCAARGRVMLGEQSDDGDE